MALSANKTDQVRKTGTSREFVINNGSTVYQGGLTIINSSGYAIALAHGTAGQYVGLCFRAGSLPPSTAGAGATGNAAGTVKCACDTKGSAVFKISSATVADLGKLAYGVDDETVAASNGNLSNSYIIGKITEIIDSTHVLVDMEDRVL